MRAIETELPGVLLIEPQIHDDERGFLFESYNDRTFERITGANTRFVQHNHTRSHRNVLRGLHYQVRRPQGKLVRVAAGTIFDVAVDLRRASSTYGKWSGAVLSAENKRMCWIPPGFAHGFLTLTDASDTLYMLTDYWDAQHERCIRWDDPALNIGWPLAGEPIVSAKDRDGAPFGQAEAYP